MIEFKIAETLNKDIKKNLIFEEELNKLDKVLKVIKTATTNDEVLTHNKLSKAEISRRANMTYSTTLLKLKFLERYGFISYDQKGFKVLKEDLENAYPFKIMSLVKVWKVSLKRYDDKVEKDIQKILDVQELEEISIAEGYFQLFSRNKDYDKYILEKLRDG
ncbi:hypothetical protein [Staphylococcus aureus]|uniref:hypothetical protein n=1 Tax=Staphylococcus aureus TaxID=1280 RepID=UPI001BFD22F7|nr:hypothetical protein [Staphylococcus aureus]